jgi:DnaJ-class molecular chaperone
MSRAYAGEPEQFDEPANYTCRRCQGRVKSLENDGEHEDCERKGQIDHARQREAQRQLHRDTAWMLRKLGQAERAAVHDVEAERR